MLKRPAPFDVHLHRSTQPAPAGHPWRTMPNHGMTPHISGSSLSARTRYAARTREILESSFAGPPVRG